MYIPLIVELFWLTYLTFGYTPLMENRDNPLMENMDMGTVENEWHPSDGKYSQRPLDNYKTNTTLRLKKEKKES